MLVVNFKTYSQATGDNAVRLAKICDSVASHSETKIAVAVQSVDILRVASSVRHVSVFAQHVDHVLQGKFTGFVSCEAVKHAGASGTLLNHAEHKLDVGVLKSSIVRCRENSLKTVVCAADKEEAIKVAQLGPDFIAVEPPELIGTLVSVSKAKPEVITSSVAAVKKLRNIPILCGAGISNGGDVKKAIKLGTSGILVATAVVLAKNPEKALLDLVKGFG